MLKRFSLIALAIIASCAIFSCDQSKNKFEAPPPPTVTVANPQQIDVTSFITFSGRTDTTESVEVRARVPGYLKSIEFEDSARVEKGQLLFTIEPEPYEAAVASAEANKERNIAEFKLMETTSKRQDDLYKQKVVSELDMLKAKAEMYTAEAAVSQTDAALDAAELNLSYTKITSPISGRVSRSYVDVGNLVGQGESTLLTTIVSEDPIHVYFNISERELLKFMADRPKAENENSKRRKCFLQLADGSDYDQPGKVDYVDNRVNPDTGTIEARAIFPNPNGDLAAGLFARIRFPETLESAIVIPETAVQRDIAGPFVMTVDTENTAQKKFITLGPKVEEGQVVTDGLSTADTIVVKGIQRAREGAKVTPETEASQSNPAPEQATEKAE